jgi:hypothetical protein
MWGYCKPLITFSVLPLRDFWKEVQRRMRKSNVALRLQESLLDEARRVAETEGVALNQFINVAVAEKLSALRIEDYFRERAASGNVEIRLFRVTKNFKRS